MSTHPIDRRRIRPVGRRIELRRIMSLIAVLIGVFAVAFGIGHIKRTAPTIVEKTPPRLPVVAVPVAGSLPAAPAIKVAVAKPPARTPAPKVAKPATSAPAVAETPVVSHSSPAPAPTPAPAAAPIAPVHSAPPPAANPPSSSGGGSSSPPSRSSGGGSGSGTSFESSG
jgi:hypothetical protein